MDDGDDEEDEGEEEEEEEEEADEEAGGEEGETLKPSDVQLHADMFTLSALPSAHWKTVLSLDVIKKRNKPVTAAPLEPPTCPPHARSRCWHQIKHTNEWPSCDTNVRARCRALLHSPRCFPQVAPPKAPKAAPFFLPTLPGVQRTFDPTPLNDDEEEEGDGPAAKKSRMLYSRAASSHR